MDINHGKMYSQSNCEYSLFIFSLKRFKKGNIVWFIESYSRGAWLTKISGSSGFVKMCKYKLCKRSTKVNKNMDENKRRSEANESFIKNT